MKKVMSVRLEDFIVDRLDTLVEIEKKRRQNLGITTEVTRTELIEEAINEYYVVKIEDDNGGLLVTKFTDLSERTFSRFFNKMMQAMSEISKNDEVIKSMLRVVLNSVDEGLSEDDKRKLIESSSFDSVIENRVSKLKAKDEY